MLIELTPTRWYYLSGSSGPVPCCWEGLVYLSGSLGRQWLVVVLMGE